MDSSGLVAGKRPKKKKNFVPSDGYVEKYDFRGQPTVIIKDFEPEVFKLLIDYTHTGSVILQSRTLLGLMNAADHYCLEELKQACIRSMERCITIETVCILLATAEKYIQYKSTKTLIQKILEFVDVNAKAIFSLEDFVNLPQHIVRIVLGREELKASEIEKFETAYRWSLRYCQSYPASDIKVVFEPFVDVIKYSDIPTRMLMQRVKPTGVVDETHLLTALAFQADPSSVLPLRPMSALVSGIPCSSSPLQKRSTSPSFSSRYATPFRNFRRVRSSGNTIECGVNFKSSSTPSASFLLSVLADSDSREARAGSAPLNVSDGELHCPRMKRREDLFLRESEVHPLCLHDMREHVISSSSSILSTPPLSPAPSLSVMSHQGSLVSMSSSGDSAHSNTSPSRGLMQASTGGSCVSVASSGSVQGKPGVSNMKILSYDPKALDAIMNLSISNAVEV